MDNIGAFPYLIMILEGAIFIVHITYLLKGFLILQDGYLAFKLVFELAGLETGPGHGSEAAKLDFSYKGKETYKIAVKIDGE